MIVYCCGMYRSSSTLQYQIVAELLGDGIGHLADELTEKEKSGEPLVGKVHPYTKERGKLIEEGKAKAVYIHRDIRDVAVSMMYRAKMPFSLVIRNEYIERALKYYKGWTQHDIYITTYDKMMNDTRGEILRHAKYLGVDVTDKKINELINKYSIRNQIKRYNANDDITPRIHSGKSRWRKVLNPIQIAWIEGIAYDWLKEHYDTVEPDWLRKSVYALYKLYKRIRHYKEILKSRRCLCAKPGHSPNLGSYDNA